MKEAFRDSPLGVTIANQRNHDLIMDISFLRNLIRTKVKPLLGENQVNESQSGSFNSIPSAFHDFLVNPTPEHKAAVDNHTP